MGNCCGSESGNFQGEGRTLNAAPASAPAQSSGNQSAAVPPKISGSQGQGRTLGKAPDQSTSAGEAAARAAEERAKASQQGRGKLGKQLDAQKSQTQTETLAQNARDNVAHREADNAAQARNWD